MSGAAKIPKTIMGAEYYHNMNITGKNISVAVLDSGLTIHPDIKPYRIIAFIDFIEDGKAPYDDYSHGTHVTGIIASKRIGIAPETNIISIKVLDKKGSGNIDTFIEGIKWILKNHKAYNIRIVNISIGSTTKELTFGNNILNKWVKKLWDKGIIVCCSAGNNGPKAGTITAPGNCKEVITVGSSDGKHFSSAGALTPFITKPEIVAPGYHILSTKPYSGYQIKNGTSMSVPFVSGAIALLLQLNPGLSNDEVKLSLMNSATPSNHLPYNMQGAGELSLHALLSQYI